MFFASFWSWLTALLGTYVSTNAAKVAAAIEPAALTLAVIYVMMWGFLSLTGRLQEPIWEGVKRIFVIVLIIGIALRLWTYNNVIADTFFNAPSALASHVVGAANPVLIIDDIWTKGGKVGEVLWNKGSAWTGDFGFYIAGLIVWVFIGAVAVVSMFLMALSKVALAVILALGPIFITLLFFDTTKRFFEAWIAQLANYGLIAILTSLIGSMMLSNVDKFATAAVTKGSSIVTVDVLNMLLLAALVLLVMRQVMPIAAGLGSGIALSSYGVISGFVRWGMGAASRSTYQFGRGVGDGLRGDQRSRWDSLRRGAGNRVGTGISRLAGAGRREGGTVVQRDTLMPPRRSVG